MAASQQGNSAALVVNIASIPEEGLVFQAEVMATHLQLPPTTEVELPTPVQVRGWLTKVTEQVYFQGTLRGTLAAPCSRCLDIIHSDFTAQMRVVYLPPSTRLQIEGEEGVDAEDELDLYMHDGVHPRLTTARARQCPPGLSRPTLVPSRLCRIVPGMRGES